MSERNLSFRDRLGPVQIGIGSFHFRVGNSLLLPQQRQAPAAQCRLAPLLTCLRGCVLLTFTQALPWEMREIAPASSLLFPILPPTPPQTYHCPHGPVTRYLGTVRRLEGVMRGQTPCVTREKWSDRLYHKIENGMKMFFISEYKARYY